MTGRGNTDMAIFPEIEADQSGPISDETFVSVIPIQRLSCAEERGRFVRAQIDTAARPILASFARRMGLHTALLQNAIDGPMPLQHPHIVRRLGGALHSKDMRCVIETHADPALVPLKVRTGIAQMSAQGLSSTPPMSVRDAFPDWDKPTVPPDRQLQSWRPEDAAMWLLNFPPDNALLHPLDVWDASTAALWLNDRDHFGPSPPSERRHDPELVTFVSDGSEKPSLEVLHTLHDIELEELTYRVFVERLRREIMSFYLSERRAHIRKVSELVMLGYRTMNEARRSVRAHDIRRHRYFGRVFVPNHEWVYDLWQRIAASYAWPDGFAGAELIDDL